jgi:hypothetical protein
MKSVLYARLRDAAVVFMVVAALVAAGWVMLNIAHGLARYDSSALHQVNRHTVK